MRETNNCQEGFLKGSKSNIIDSSYWKIPRGILDGLTIDGTDITLNKIEDFKMTVSESMKWL